MCGVQDQEVPCGTGNGPYTAAVAVLDSDMAQYVHDNTEDAGSLAHLVDSNGAPHRRAVLRVYKVSIGPLLPNQSC